MSTEDKMNIDERRKYLRRMKKHYVQAGRKDKGRLLDEMEALTELHPPGWKPQEPDPADEWEPGAQTSTQATGPHLWAGGFVLRLDPRGSARRGLAPLQREILPVALAGSLAKFRNH